MAPDITVSEHVSKIIDHAGAPFVAIFPSLRSITNLQETSLLESSHYTESAGKKL